MRIILSSIATGLLLLPSLSFAANLSTLNEKVIFQSETNLYRLRLPSKPWQLVGLASGFQLEKFEVINDRTFLVGQLNGRKVLYLSTDGLRFTTMPEFTGEEVVVKKVGQFVVVAMREAGVITFRIANQSWQWQVASAPILLSLTDIDRLFDVGGELTHVGQGAAAVVSVFRQGNWISAATLPCASSSLITQPRPAINCSSQIYYQASLDNWQPLFPVSVAAIAAGQYIFAADALTPPTFYVFNGTTLSTVSVGGFAGPVTALQTFGSRYFIRADQLWELSISPTPQLQSVDPNPAAVLVPTNGSERLYMHQTGREAASDQIGSWLPITIAGDYNQAEKTSGGWLLWKRGGSLTQFAAATSSSYQPVTTSWAASSKIQEMVTTATTTYLWLLNSSNKPNIYKTADFSQWTRITLPNDTTQAVSVDIARTLPAGSLVNIVGIISVAPGVVSNDVLYVQDDTGGMQVFLSQTKGALPTSVHRQAEVTGSISSSQSKRITLDALDDLIVGDSQSLTLPEITPSEAITKLGQTFTLKAKVGAISNDYLSLEATSAMLRLRYEQLSTEYKVADEGTFPAVVDYNSSSGLVESWSLGDDELTNRITTPPPAPTPEQTTEGATENVATTVSAVVQSSEKTSERPTAKTATKTTVAPKAVVTSTREIETAVPTAIATNEPLVLPVQDKLNGQTIPVSEALLLSFLSLLAGILSLRGRRFRRFFTD